MDRNKKKINEYEYIEDGKTFIVKVDAVTREVISKVPAKPRVNKGSYFDRGSFLTMQYKRMCKMLKTKKEYSNLTFRLLFELMERIEFNNRITTFRQAELAEILESHQQNISTSLKSLEKDGVIKKVKHDYYFTPKFIRFVNDGFDHLKETAEDIDSMEEEAAR